MKPWKNGPYRTILFSGLQHVDRIKRKLIPSKADAIVLDLEDAVPEQLKDKARTNFSSLLSRTNLFSSERKVMVRPNSPDTEHGQKDLDVLSKNPDIHALFLPKVESIEHIKQASEATSAPLWLAIETAKGLLNINEVLERTKEFNIAALIFGNNDLGANLGIEETSASMKIARTNLVITARAHDLMVFDGPVTDLSAQAHIAEESAYTSRDLGFDGKVIIHPHQINVTNMAFTPTNAEIKECLSLSRNYAQQSVGATGHDGKMVEDLHINKARETLKINNSIKLTEEGNKRFKPRITLKTQRTPKTPELFVLPKNISQHHHATI